MRGFVTHVCTLLGDAGLMTLCGWSWLPLATRSELQIAWRFAQFLWWVYWDDSCAGHGKRQKCECHDCCFFCWILQLTDDYRSAK